jgi:hypothetical protein
MAKFIPGPLVSSISGTVGQVVFSSYKGVGVIRKLPASVFNPNSPAQTAARTAASYISQQYANLQPIDDGSWEAEAAAINKERKGNAGGPGCHDSIMKGHTGPMSGFNAFLLRNYNRYSAGITPYTQILTNPNLGVPRPEGLATTQAVVVNNTIVFSWTLITNVPKLDRLKLWIRSIDAHIHVQLIATAPCFPAGSITISTVRSVSGIPITLPPGRYNLQAKVTDINGRESVDSEVITVRLGPDNFNQVYFAPRTLLVNLPNLAAAIPWTTLSVAGLVPPNANAIIVYTEIETFLAGLAGTYAIINLRKDVTQGISLQRQITGNAPAIVPVSDSGIIPLTSTLSFDYQVTKSVDVTTYNARVYLIGYVY